MRISDWSSDVCSSDLAVSRVLAERAAGKQAGGSIDLIWLNGENFAAMKAQQLLYGPFTKLLPNFRLVDFDDKPSTLVDFTRSEEHTSELQSLMRISYAVFCLKKKKNTK